MSGVPSSGPGGEAQARVNDLAPGSRRASSGALAPQWLAPGLTAFRGVLSADSGPLWRTLVNLWPYIWPSDRRDLKVRVLW